MSKPSFTFFRVTGKDKLIPTDESPFGDESEETKESDIKLKEKLSDLHKLVR